MRYYRNNSMKGNSKSGRDTKAPIQSKGILGAQDTNFTIQSKRTQSKGAPGGHDTCVTIRSKRFLKVGEIIT